MQRQVALWVSIVSLAACSGEVEPVKPAPDAAEPSDTGASDAIDVGAEDAEPPLDPHDAGVSADAGEVDAQPSVDAVELIDGRLALRTGQLPFCVDCEDRDGDGLADAWEALALAAFRPAVRLAEDEPYLTDPEARLLQVARVFPVSTDPLLVHALIAVAWHQDYGSACGGISGHAGDPERVAVELEALPGGAPGDVILARAYTAGHENTATDVSRLFAKDELDQLEYTAEPRWAIYASLRKHASFANVSLCEDASNIPCLRERCGATAELLPDAINAGEPELPLVDDLAALGFPGDSAWSDTDFCGGQESLVCSGPISNKLVADPFEGL